MNNEKQLTPEEKIEPFFESNAVSFKGEYYVEKSSFYACMEEYASQQTAAKDEEITKLKEGIKNLKIAYEAGTKAIEKHDGVVNDIFNESLKKDERIKELEKELKELRQRLALECTDMVRVMGERDQAFDLLEEAIPILKDSPFDSTIDLGIRAEALLSSRENKNK